MPAATDSLGLIDKYPSLFQYAKAMGYHTVYMDAQTTTLWNGMNSSDIKYIDEWIKATDLSDSNLISDFLAADKIREIVDASVGNFIMVNKRGVHFAYEENYPDENKVWSPIPPDPSSYENNPDQTANAYDNAILYNVNTFWIRLFPNAANLDEYVKNSTYIYTSDHGETLYEEGARATHCSATRQESRVPLIIFGVLPEPLDTSYHASHSNILPTILDLMGFPQETRPYQYNLSLLEATLADSKDRFFICSDGATVNHDELERKAGNQQDKGSNTDQPYTTIRDP